MAVAVAVLGVGGIIVNEYQRNVDRMNEENAKLAGRIQALEDRGCR